MSSNHSDDNQQLEGPKHSSPAKTHQWDGSPGYEPSSVTGHKPIVVTIGTGGAKVHNPKDTHSQVHSAHGSNKRSSSSEAGHETLFMDSTKKRERKSIRKDQLVSLQPQGSFLSPCIKLHGQGL